MKKPSKEQLQSDLLNELTWSEIASKYGYTDSRFLRKVAKSYELEPKRKFLKPTKEVLEDLILVQKLPPKEIATKLGYSSGGWSNIYKYCREYGIPVDFMPNTDLRKIDFSLIQKSIIIGTLLGDGYLRPSSKYPALSIAHGTKQLDYLNWLREHLSNFIVSDNRLNVSKSNLGHDNTYSFNTISHPYLKNLRDLLYPNGKKTVTQTYLDMVDDLALAIWYMDDGSRNKRYKTLTLCTNCFSYEEHLLMQKWFMDKYSIPVVIENRRNNMYSLRINASVSQNFLDIVSPHIPSCMKYKIGE